MSAPQTKLQKLIALANAEVRALHDKLTKAEAANLKEAVRPLRNKLNVASRKRSSLESLLTSDEGRLKQLLDHAADKRRMASNLEPRKPAKAKLIRQEAKAIEKRYLLWCEHHGKAPTLLAPPKAKEEIPAPPRVVPEKKRGRGGKRGGAGRPALGHVQLLLKCSPGTADKARKLSKAKGMTLGGWLDSVIDSLNGRE
jgi:hypothetical protein